MSNTRSIAIVGVGGQGTVLTSDILIEGLVDLGFDVKKNRAARPVPAGRQRQLHGQVWRRRVRPHHRRRRGRRGGGL